MKERYRSMMEQAVLSEQAKAAFEQKLDNAHPTKKGVRVLRTALVAACVCLVLVGGAFAATQIAGFYDVSIFENLRHEGRSYDGYSLVGGCRFVPLDELSLEIRKLSEQNPASTTELPVHSLGDFESLIGLDLADIPSSDELNFQRFTAYLTSDQSDPTRLSYVAEYRGAEDNSLCLLINATVYTEQMEDPNFDISTSYVFPSGNEFSAEQYITDGGLEILLTHIQYFPSDILFNIFGSNSYYADFVLDGIRYHLLSYCPNHPEQALDVMKRTLEGFCP